MNTENKYNLLNAIHSKIYVVLGYSEITKQYYGIYSMNASTDYIDLFYNNTYKRKIRDNKIKVYKDNQNAYNDAKYVCDYVNDKYKTSQVKFNVYRLYSKNCPIYINKANLINRYMIPFSVK